MPILVASITLWTGTSPPSCSSHRAWLSGRNSLFSAALSMAMARHSLAGPLHSSRSLRPLPQSLRLAPRSVRMSSRPSMGTAARSSTAAPSPSLEMLKQWYMPYVR
uniref:Putative secreted protein n=1 Tax=Ixodes ricinus TaxID=34613 RepID=A0A6B0UDH2_IXORI